MHVGFSFKHLKVVCFLVLQFWMAPVLVLKIEVLTELFLVQECLYTWARCTYWWKSICIRLYSCIQLVVESARLFFQLLVLCIFMFWPCLYCSKYEITLQKITKFQRQVGSFSFLSSPMVCSDTIVL